MEKYVFDPSSRKKSESRQLLFETRLLTLTVKFEKRVKVVLSIQGLTESERLERLLHERTIFIKSILSLSKGFLEWKTDSFVGKSKTGDSSNTCQVARPKKYENGIDAFGTGELNEF